MRIRCYLEPEAWNSPEVHLSGPQAHHLIHVLRIKPGATVTCFDGRGSEAVGVVSQVGRRDVSLRIQERCQMPAPSWKITLGVAIPKGSRMDQTIDQATQLGVSALIPLITERGVVKISPSGAASKQARWRQIAVEAAKQCGVGRLPEIDPPTPWAQLLRTLPSYDPILMATVEGPHEPIQPLLSGGSARNLLLLIGPEGDFTPEEIHQAVQAGAHRIGLGPTVLRCETAAVVALGLVAFLLRTG